MTFHDLFIKLHPVVIHFVIVGYVLAPLFAFLAIIAEKSGSFDSSLLVRISLLNFWIGTLFYPIAAITGIIDAQDLDRVISTDLLALKMIFGFLTIFFLITIFILLGSAIVNPDLLEETNVHLFQYLILTSVLLLCTIYTAALGGMYVFGHSVFDTLRLGFLLPTSIDQPTNNLFETSLEAVIFSPVMTGLLLIIFVAILFGIRKIS